MCRGNPSRLFGTPRIAAAPPWRIIMQRILPHIAIAVLGFAPLAVSARATGIDSAAPQSASVSCDASCPQDACPVPSCCDGECPMSASAAAK